MGFIILGVGGYFIYLANKKETDAQRMEYENPSLGGSFDAVKAWERKIEWVRFWSKCCAWIGVLLSFAGMVGILFFFLAKP